MTKFYILFVFTFTNKVGVNLQLYFISKIDITQKINFDWLSEPMIWLTSGIMSNVNDFMIISHVI